MKYPITEEFRLIIDEAVKGIGSQTGYNDFVDTEICAKRIISRAQGIVRILGDETDDTESE